MKKPAREATASQKTPTPSTSLPRRPRRKKPRNLASSRKSSPARKRGDRRSRVRLRRVLPGRTWFITKKTNDDQFFLRPDGTVDAILLYVLIEKLSKYGLLIHEFVFMSNHFHLVVTDVRGTLPAFMREFLSETGKALKGALNTTRRIWSGDRYGATALLDLDAAERFMTYTRVNPTAAGLTRPEEWPGLTSARWSFGDTIEAKRPEGYFDPRTRADRVSCVLEPLPEHFGEAQDESGGIEEESQGPSVSTLRTGGKNPGSGENERAARRKERTKHRSRCRAQEETIDRHTRTAVAQILEQMGASRKVAARTLAGPSSVVNTSRQKRGNHDYGRMNPRFATQDPKRLWAAVKDERSFRASHEEARQRYLDGEQRVLFPSGTYGYREVWGVRVRKGGAAA